MNQTKQMNPLTIAKGKLTKLGVGLTAAGPIVQNILNVLQGEEMQNVVDAAQGAQASILVLAGSVTALLGAFRAAINYGGKA